jgi:hypothetical protein
VTRAQSTVDHVDGIGGKGVEEPGRDAGTVLPEDLDEEVRDVVDRHGGGRRVLR